MRLWVRVCVCFSCCRDSNSRTQPELTVAKPTALHRGSTAAPPATLLVTPLPPEPKSASIPNRPLTEYVFPRRRHAHTAVSSVSDQSS